MKALLVARKHLVEILREPQLLLLELAMPLVFLGITAAFYTSPLAVTHPVLVQGPNPQTEPLIEVLQAQHYADGRPVFAVSRASDQAAAEAALKERTAAALVIVEGDQSPMGTTANDQPPLPVNVTIRGDPLYQRFFRASTVLSGAVERYADRVAGRPELLRVIAEPLATGEPRTEFDLFAPGMIIFALLMLIPQTAMLVGREIRWKTLRRLRLTRLGAFDLLAGVSLAQLVFAIVQVLIVFLAALALGFHNQGSLLLAVVIGLVVSFSAIGQGLLVACFIQNDSQAANVGSTFTMLEVFVSGSFFPLPPLTLFTLAGHQIDLFDVFPATHGFMALQQALTYGFGLREVAFRLGATLLLSTLYFVAGVVVFNRLQMRE